MQDYYDTYGLIKKGKCMYCLKELDVDDDDEEETADHFGYWCKVMPGYLKSRARLQWAYVEKQAEVGWFGKKGEGFKPPLLLEDDARPGRDKKKPRLRRKCKV